MSVEEYKGPMGVLRVGRAGVEREITGPLQSSDMELVVTRSGTKSEYFAAATSEQTLPVGDYSFGFMTVVVRGKYSIVVHRDDLSDDGRQEAIGQTDKRIIRIRAGEVFDFVPLESVFASIASPKSMEVFRPGDTVSVRGAILDSAYNLRVLTINKLVGTQRPTEFGPLVRIADAHGKVVVEKKLQYTDAVGATQLEIPPDLQIDGPEERCTLTMTYDTGDLFGVVEAKREIVIRAPSARERRKASQ